MSAATATLLEKWQLWAENNRESLKAHLSGKWLLHRASGCFQSVSGIFILKIAFKIGSLEAVAVTALWFKDSAKDKHTVQIFCVNIPMTNMDIKLNKLFINLYYWAFIKDICLKLWWRFSLIMRICSICISFSPPVCFFSSL